jgi:hypothetical protein
MTPEDRRAGILTIEAIGAALQALGPVQASTLYAKLTPPSALRFKAFAKLLESMQAAGLVADIGAGRLLWKGPKSPAKPVG